MCPGLSLDPAANSVRHSTIGASLAWPFQTLQGTGLVLPAIAHVVRNMPNLEEVVAEASPHRHRATPRGLSGRLLRACLSLRASHNNSGTGSDSEGVSQTSWGEDVATMPAIARG